MNFYPKISLFFFSVFAVFSLLSCGDKTNQKEKTNLTGDHLEVRKDTLKNSPVATKGECDSLKFPDFKNNLREIKYKASPAFIRETDSLATLFIKQQCKDDTLFCGEIYLKNHLHYKTASDYDLFSFAYGYKGGEKSMEEASASFFVFGVKQKGKIIFYDIVSDLMGEIQLTLCGFEVESKTLIVWGEVHPYFTPEDCGKFKLSIKEGESSYDYACKSKPHGH